jgi:ribosome-associated translation inhibitor RaiA
LAFFATDELPAELTIQLADARMHIQPVKELSIHGQHLGELMLKRRMRADLETNLTKAVNTIDIRLSPSKSQLARWRVLGRSALMRVRSIAAEEDAGQPEAAINAEIERLQTFLQREQKRRSRAWQTFERARISRGGRTIRLAEWIEKMVSADEEMWNWMDQPTEYQLGERLSAAIDPDDAFEFRIRLMDAVMAKAARQTG